MADENTDLRCYLTNAGIAAENNSIQLNRSLNVTEMVFGSGFLADEKDPREQTAMIKEEYAVPCALLFDEDTPTLLVFKGDLPADVGGFYINEVGIRLEDGTIYGYARGKGDYKPTLDQGATDSVRYAVEMYSSNADNVVAKIDLSSVYADYEDIEATKKYADERYDNHLNSTNPHPQYAVQKDVDGIKMVLIEGGVNQSVRFEIAESGQLGFSLFYNGADDNATYIQSNIFGTYRNLVKIPREVARWDFLAPAYYSGYQLLDKSFVASPAEVISGNTTKLATGEGVLAALAKAHSNGMLSPTGSYVFPKDENGLSLIIQWGIDSQVTGQGNGDKTVVLPITFPNGIFLALTTPGVIGATSGDCVGYVAGNQTNFTYNWNSNNATGFEVSWFALGY
ncbi:phage tail-collar fiber domain-containing protein [Vibrio fluvialis]|uniref:phage tail-collar fiber domain-containing protein n=1 Tax=Vibrio fluvialis TaxID=676 RepID=UPI001EEC9745|nr:phage tail protein [Vibrio fluvialis]MCG6400154.1 phage tail protein [Vibrio fluvialis]